MTSASTEAWNRGASWSRLQPCEHLEYSLAGAGAGAMNRSIPVLITGLMTCVCLHAISGIRLMEVLQKFHLGAALCVGNGSAGRWSGSQAGGKDNLCCGDLGSSGLEPSRAFVKSDVSERTRFRVVRDQLTKVDKVQASYSALLCRHPARWHSCVSAGCKSG